MADMSCIKCGEPWDAYGVNNGDMEPHEAKRFKRGEGCPSCNFGTQCDQCDGSGREVGYSISPDCKTCRDKGYVLGRWIKDEVSIGWQPTVRYLGRRGDQPKKTIGAKKLPAIIRTFDCLEGVAVEYWLLCPDCKGEGDILPCRFCDGSGALKTDDDTDEWANRIQSHLDATDEEPLGVLDKLTGGEY